jgi:ribosome-associated protein
MPFGRCQSTGSFYSLYDSALCINPPSDILGDVNFAFEKFAQLFILQVMTRTPMKTLNLIAQVIFDKKGFNILALDVRGLSSITDFLLIAEGNVDRHVSSIARAVTDALEEQGETPIFLEGVKTGDWAVLDYGNIMVHIFGPALRERYSLERLWDDSKIVDLNIEVKKPNKEENHVSTTPSRPTKGH